LLKRFIHKAGQAYVRRLTANDASARSARELNERPVELRFLFECIARLQPRTVLDVGAGTSPLPALLSNCGCLVTAIDNVRDYWPSGMLNRHWQVIDDNISYSRERGPFDLVTCISTLEHIDDPQAAMASMAQALVPSGHLVLTMPYSELLSVADVYRLPGAVIPAPLPYICRSAARKDLDEWCVAAGLEVAAQEYWQLWTGEVWRQGKWLDSPVMVTKEARHQLTCVLLRRVTNIPSLTV
jgi:SAM-dependent methyltransferase